MKIQCDVCGKEEATVLCCADEAALCLVCDGEVHDANRVAGKHQRVPLLHNPPSTHLPKCDICQEKAGYFFCLEDRALLCRQCDVSIHTSTPHASSHQRFLIPGVKVGFHDYGSSSPDSLPADPSSTDTTAKEQKRHQRQLQHKDNEKQQRLSSLRIDANETNGFEANWPLDEIILGSSSTNNDPNSIYSHGFSEYDYSPQVSGEARQ